ncbi:MAG: F0F1 ATP synthase subunit A [Chloroflexi bacterium]|nr:MAG: F0F1 ATP synthase subunit A [Chloroflexota bacterium]
MRGSNHTCEQPVDPKHSGRLRHCGRRGHRDRVCHGAARDGGRILDRSARGFGERTARPALARPRRGLHRPESCPAIAAHGTWSWHRPANRSLAGLVGDRGHCRCSAGPRRLRGAGGVDRVIFLAEAPPGTHPTVSVCGAWYCTFNYDSLISSAIAIIITIVVGFLVADRLSRGVPGKLQLLFEFLIDYVRGLVRESVGEGGGFIVPLAMTLGFYILVANWIDFFPLAGPVHPANADLNQTLALALVVIIVVQAYSLRVLGVRGYFRRFTKPFEMALPVRIAFIPLNIVEELVKPVTLSLRLFGNIFAGALMVYLIGSLITFLAGLVLSGGLTTTLGVVFGPLAEIGLIIWKAFDIFFVGTIQAFIFTLLTIIYFGMAREGLEEEAHGEHQRPAPATVKTGG